MRITNSHIHINGQTFSVTEHFDGLTNIILKKEVRLLVVGGVDQLHSPDDGITPSITVWDCMTGKVQKQQTHFRNKLHSFNDNPSSIEFWRNGRVMTKSWHHHGKRSRLKGPALIKYCRLSDHVFYRGWSLDGRAHRSVPERPAWIYYCTDSDVVARVRWTRTSRRDGVLEMLFNKDEELVDFSFTDPRFARDLLLEWDSRTMSEVVEAFKIDDDEHD